ncbi:hypothetical protein L210DRAFT_988267 [Boletus edulis BED1]|uniref:Uncharacterized protein n=1 Tax=Boletus edulis BED1 TaxID=1328754 RepID=A0AAD4BFM2_BOLED|nr:hypothetical protein L210DRAFT_988267 [Boletus edulis BED1]
MTLSYRFDRLGELNDLEDAISKYRDAIDLTPLKSLGVSVLVPRMYKTQIDLRTVD